RGPGAANAARGLGIEKAVAAGERSGRDHFARKATVTTGGVGDPSARIIGDRLPADAAGGRRASRDLTPSADRPGLRNIFLDVEIGIVLDGLAGLGVDALGPGHLIDILVGVEKLAVGAVEPVEEAIASPMRQDLPVLTIDRQSDDLVDAVLVVVP